MLPLPKRSDKEI